MILEEREDIRTDLPWSILIFLAMGTLAIFRIGRICTDYDYTYSQELFDFIHSFYLSMYYGNNTFSESEFFEEYFEEYRPEDSEWTKYVYQLLVDIVAPVVFTFFFWVSAKYSERLMRFLDIDWEEFQEVVQWLGLPCCYLSFFALFMMKWLMFPYLRIIRSLYQVPPICDCTVYLLTILCYCYIFFVLYYYVKMVVTILAVRVFYDEKRYFKGFIISLVNAMRYHSGTVCFNATVILPPLLALKTTIRRSNDLQNIHNCMKEGNRVKRFFRNLYVIFFITDYTTTITAAKYEGAVDATKSTFDLVNFGLPVQYIKIPENWYMVLATYGSVGYLVVLSFVFFEDVDFSEIVLESAYYFLTVFIPLMHMVYGTVVSTRDLCRWCHRREWYQDMAVAG